MTSRRQFLQKLGLSALALTIPVPAVVAAVPITPERKPFVWVVLKSYETGYYYSTDYFLTQEAAEDCANKREYVLGKIVHAEILPIYLNEKIHKRDQS